MFVCFRNLKNVCVFQKPYNVIRYSLAPDVDNKIKEYFDVDPETGVIFLQKSLMLDEENNQDYGVR